MRYADEFPLSGQPSCSLVPVTSNTGNAGSAPPLQPSPSRRTPRGLRRAGLDYWDASTSRSCFDRYLRLPTHNDISSPPPQNKIMPIDLVHLIDSPMRSSSMTKYSHSAGRGSPFRQCRLIALYTALAKSSLKNLNIHTSQLSVFATI